MQMDYVMIDLSKHYFQCFQVDEKLNDFLKDTIKDDYEKGNTILYYS